MEHSLRLSVITHLFLLLNQLNIGTPHAILKHLNHFYHYHYKVIRKSGALALCDA